MLEKNTDAKLRAYVVWVPKIGGQEKDVPTATRFVPDDRARHYWDGQSTLVKGYKAVLSLSEDVWDVYMIYGPEARWESGAPPEPDYWMHQLDGVKSAPELDADLFAAKVKTFSPASGGL